SHRKRWPPAAGQTLPPATTSTPPGAPSTRSRSRPPTSSAFSRVTRGASFRASTRGSRRGVSDGAGGDPTRRRELALERGLRPFHHGSRLAALSPRPAQAAVRTAKRRGGCALSRVRTGRAVSLRAGAQVHAL